MLLVNRFVFEAFNGIPTKGNHIDHIDRNKLNNELSNLREVTPSENLKNRDEFYRMSQRGLDPNTVRQIRERAGIKSIAEIAKEFDCGTATVQAIVMRKSYKDIK